MDCSLIFLRLQPIAALSAGMRACGLVIGLVGRVIIGAWKHSLNNLFDCVSNVADSTFLKVMEQGAAAQIQELHGLLKKMIDGECPADLAPFRYDEFMDEIVQKLPFFFHCTVDGG